MVLSALTILAMGDMIVGDPEISIECIKGDGHGY
jgi:hypothetical protein